MGSLITLLLLLTQQQQLKTMDKLNHYKSYSNLKQIDSSNCITGWQLFLFLFFVLAAEQTVIILITKVNFSIELIGSLKWLN